MTAPTESGQHVIPRAVIWDVEGTILSSKPYHARAWQLVLGEEGHGSVADKDFGKIESLLGSSNDEIAGAILGHKARQSEIRRLSDKKESRYFELVRAHELALLPGVAEWLCRFKKTGWSQVVASSGPKETIVMLLTALGIEEYFDKVITAEDVIKGKPAPDIFYLAATTVNVPPKRCIVIEDGAPGIEGARRAGMTSIGVLTSRPHLNADLVVNGLDKLSEDVLEALVEGRYFSAANLRKS